MMDRIATVSEGELHAYVDGELPLDQREAVAAWLAEHPEQASSVAAWQAQAESIRARFGAVADEPVPDRLKLDNIMRSVRGNTRNWRTIAAAAAIVVFIGGGATGWMARGTSMGMPSGFERFTAHALDAHKLYVVEVRHPVEMPGSEVSHMTQWLSKRLGYEQPIPDLQSVGLKLVGGRLLPGPTGAAAFYMYEGPSGERFTIYCGKATSEQTALRYKSGEQAAAFYWVDDKRAYVVSGPANREQLEKVSKVVYEQLDEISAKKS